MYFLSFSSYFPSDLHFGPRNLFFSRAIVPPIVNRKLRQAVFAERRGARLLFKNRASNDREWQQEISLISFGRRRFSLES